MLPKDLESLWRNMDRDVVLLHQFPRPASGLPNMSPFAVKLETFLRARKVSYACDFDVPMNLRGKCPWIHFNGRPYDDSQIIVETLCRSFHVDVDECLTPKEKAVARSLRVALEEHCYWGLALHRWVHHPEYLVGIKDQLYFGIPKFLNRLVIW